MRLLNVELGFLSAIQRFKHKSAFDERSDWDKVAASRVRGKKMKNQNIWIALTALLFLAACSTTQVNVPYTANPSIVLATKAKSVVAMGTIADNRKNGPNWLGAIRGGFGNPLKTLETEKPVAEVVKTALEDGLSSVHLLTTHNPKYTLNVDLIRFNCNQYARREAHIDMTVSLVENSSGQTVYTKKIKADKVTGSIITFDAGLFASVDDLRQVANDVLQNAVDQLLSDSAFSAALQ
jgi:uncharacterized lipoprotein YajG